MKKNVALSTYCRIISAITIAIICGVSVYAFTQPNGKISAWILSAVFLCVLLYALWYMPMALVLDRDKLNIYRPLRIKSISISDIQNVRLCPPTMGEKRIFGSGGFMGYYGWFSERNIGKYFAYYGKASDCFLVTLKNGKKYMLGCKDAPEMVDAINILTSSAQTKHF